MISPIYFSIIIPLYNKRESVYATIMSVLNQTYSFFEIIVVDDGSTDESPEVVEALKDDRIKLIKQTNAGVSAARNKGIKESKFDYISFLDADDLWEPNYLNEMTEFIKSFPGAGLYGCAYDRIHREIVKPVNFHLPKSFKGIVNNYFEHAGKNHLFWTSAVVIDKRKVERIGFFDERINIMGEDLDLWFRTAYYFPVAFQNKVLAHYNTGAENRGMMRKHPYSKSILCYLDKYSEMEKENSEFRQFINHFRFSKIPELYSQYQLRYIDINIFLKSINTHELTFGRRFFLLFPVRIQKVIICFWEKMRKA